MLNVRTSLTSVEAPVPGTMVHATTVRLGTSSLQHRSFTISIGVPCSLLPAAGYASRGVPERAGRPSQAEFAVRASRVVPHGTTREQHSVVPLDTQASLFRGLAAPS